MIFMLVVALCIKRCPRTQGVTKSTEWIKEGSGHQFGYLYKIFKFVVRNYMHLIANFILHSYNVYKEYRGWLEVLMYIPLYKYNFLATMMA